MISLTHSLLDAKPPLLHSSLPKFHMFSAYNPALIATGDFQLLRCSNLMPSLTPSVASAIFRSSGSSSASSDSDGKKRMFVFGMGYVGQYVAKRLMKEDGWEVSGTCTTARKKRDLEEMGCDAFLFDATKDRLDDLSSLRYTTHLLLSIPPYAGIGDPLFHHFVDLQSALGHGNLTWMCYLSSTSVYGDCGGSLVTENYPANPIGDSSKARLVVEQDWLNLGHQLGISTCVFRLGGIYGPGRSALDTLLKGKSLSNSQRMRKSRRFTARIHVADIYAAVKASFNLAISGGIYNIVDDDPAPRSEVFAFAETMIEQKWPGSLQVHQSEDTFTDPSSGKRCEKQVSNVRLKAELGVNLDFPDYKSGLLDILNSYNDLSELTIYKSNL